MDKKLHQPLGGNEMPRFGGIATMMRLPHIQSPDELNALDAAFVGVPLDIGTSLRSGTRFGPRQIRVNMVLPGATDTEGNRRIGTLDNEAAVKALIEHTALRRFGHPEDVAPAVVFLASDDAAWITGTMLEASGGFS